MRFPEFSGEWEKVLLSSACEINPKTGPLDNQFLYIDLESVVKGSLVKRQIIEKDGAPSRAQRVLKENDILYQCVRPYQLNNYIFEGDTIQCVASTGYAQLRTTQFPLYIFQALHTKQFTNQVLERCTGTNYPAINSSDLGTVEVPICSLPEQVKIGSLLALIDSRIKTQSKIIEELTALRSALHQGIMSTGLEDGSWRMQTLAEVLSERTELNNEGHAVHSVSVSKGIVNQIEYLGRSFAAKDTSRYHVAYPGDVVYTKSPTGEFPYGIVKQSQIPIKAALSPLYGVYVPITQEIGYIIHNHFLSAKNALNYLHPLIQKGAKNTINITNQRFLQNSMPLPSSNSVARLYFKTIKTLSDKIELEISILHQLQIQKRKLLNDMFI